MAQFNAVRNLTNQGGSLRLTLPKTWTDANGLKNGDAVYIVFDVDKLTVEPIKKRPKA